LLSTDRLFGIIEDEDWRCFIQRGKEERNLHDGGTTRAVAHGEREDESGDNEMRRESLL
jgi:hypothetical protein